MRKRSILASLLALPVLVVAIAILALVIRSDMARPPASQVFLNGRILTLDERNPLAEAVLLEGARIVAVGSREEVSAQMPAGTRVIDLEGKTLIPGFIDAHGHFPGSGLNAIGVVDLNAPPIGDVTSMEQLLARLQRKAAETEPGEWVRGFGYDDSLLAEGRHPTRRDLDRVSTEHPVFLMHVSGHFAVGNSLALERVGITAATSDPEGGVIRREPGTQEPDGVLEETARLPLVEMAMDFGFVGFLKMVRDAAEEYAAQGVTTAQSGLTHEQTLQGLFMVSKLGFVPMRLELWPDVTLGEKIAAGEFVPADYTSDHLTIGAVKLVADGSIQGYTGYLSEPYYTPFKGDASYRGYPTMTLEELTEEVESLHRAGLQMAIHANGDAAIDDVITAFRRAQRATPHSDPRLIVVHAQMARPDQLDAMKELGMTPSFFSAHTYYWGDRHWEIFMGPERARRMSPAKSALERGLRFSIHLDTPVVPMNPLLLMASAVERVSTGGRVIGAEERIDPMQALRAVTLDAAWQIHQEDNRGSIEVGKLADLVVLSADPLEPGGSLRDIRVERTIVGGRTIFEAK